MSAPHHRNRRRPKPSATKTALPSPGITKNYVFDPDRPLPPDRELVQDLLSEGELVLWIGREKHRKSSLLLQFAVCLALGRPFLNFKVVSPCK
jgi:hypothetical protein